MHFDHPTILLLLWLLPGVAALLVVAQKRRTAAARRFVSQPMIARLMPDLHGSRPWIKGTLLLLGLALLVVAAAGPQYGVFYEKVKQRGVDCFVLLDVSRSMLAEDVVPNRLARAKSDINDLLRKMPSDRVGLIVFAGKAVLKVPLTTDDGFFRMVLDDIDTRSAPRGGTMIGDAIRKALDSLPPKTTDHDQVLVLLTDGEDQESYPLEAAKQAAERGMKIFTVGLGDSAEGARIPIRDESGNLEYVKDEGKEHWSKADQSVLQQIAQATGGAHVSAGTQAYDLGQIYEDRLAGLTRGVESQEMGRKRYHEQFQIFLAVALALLAAERLIPAYGKNAKKLNGQAIRAAAILLVACTFGLSTLGAAPAEAASGNAAQKVAEGIDAFRGGNFKAASEAFGAAAEAMPNEPRIAFDRGCAFAARGQNDKAVEQFRIAAAARNSRLAAVADYNLGCLGVAKAKAKFGEKPEEAKPEVRQEAMESLDEAAGYWRDCLAVDPEYADARYNLETVRLWTQTIQKAWHDRDLQRRRLEMNLLQFLQWMENEQRELRANERPLALEPASPRRREAIRAIENAQTELADEIGPLKEKIHAAFTAPATVGGTTGQPATPQPVSPEAEKALAVLNGLADEAGSAMKTAADSLAAANPADAVKPQADAIEKIDSIFMVVSPFVELVKKGMATEEGLIAKSTEAGGNVKNGVKSEKGEKSKKGENGEPDWAEAAWQQRFISNYGRILAAKARRELEQLAKTPAASSPAKNGEAAGQPNAEQQQKEMKRALQAGVDLAPKVVQSSNEAAGHLDASQPKAALPPQEETLKLLKEMLPKDEQKKNEQDKKDQEKKDQDKKNQDKKDQDKKDKEKQDQKKDQKKDEKKDQAKGQQQKQDPSEQQAEAAMRKVRQRQQERREMQKVLLQKLYRPDKVDKDW
jgi:Ca-activated chloride channel family protein